MKNRRDGSDNRVLSKMNRKHTSALMTVLLRKTEQGVASLQKVAK